MLFKNGAWVVCWEVELMTPPLKCNSCCGCNCILVGCPGICCTWICLGGAVADVVIIICCPDDDTKTPEVVTWPDCWIDVPPWLELAGAWMIFFSKCNFCNLACGTSDTIDTIDVGNDIGAPGTVVGVCASIEASIGFCPAKCAGGCPEALVGRLTSGVDAAGKWSSMDFLLLVFARDVAVGGDITSLRLRGKLDDVDVESSCCLKNSSWPGLLLELVSDSGFSNCWISKSRLLRSSAFFPKSSSLSSLRNMLLPK